MHRLNEKGWSSHRSRSDSSLFRTTERDRIHRSQTLDDQDIQAPVRKIERAPRASDGPDVDADLIKGRALVSLMLKTSTIHNERVQELSSVVRRLSSSSALVDAHARRKFEFELRDYHRADINALCLHLNSNPTLGLTHELAAKRLKETGRNVISSVYVHPVWIKFILAYLSGFAPLLIVSAVVVFLSWKPFGLPPTNVYNLALAIVLLLVIFVSGTFTFVQEISAEKALAGLNKLVPLTCHVIRCGRRINGVEEGKGKRNGKGKGDIARKENTNSGLNTSEDDETGHEGSVNAVTLTISPEELVVGDVVLLEAGCTVPSDCRIIEGVGLKLDKSMLTGESRPVHVNSKPVSDPDVSLLTSSNIAFLGTTVLEGVGKGLVIATGCDNQLSKIAIQASDARSATQQSSLQIEINYFVTRIALFSVLTALICVLYWAFYLRVVHPQFMNLSALLANAIAVVVAYVPEGLPLALSLGLTLIARRLCSIHKVLVKQLAVIETLGGISFLASDKTGTLTLNDFKVTALITSAGILENGIATMDKGTSALQQWVDSYSMYGSRNRKSDANQDATTSTTTTSTTISARGSSSTSSTLAYTLDCILRIAVTCSQANIQLKDEASASTETDSSRAEDEKDRIELVGGNATDRLLLSFAASLFSQPYTSLSYIRSSLSVEYREPFASKTKVTVVFAKEKETQPHRVRLVRKEEARGRGVDKEMTGGGRSKWR